MNARRRGKNSFVRLNREKICLSKMIIKWNQDWTSMCECVWEIKNEFFLSSHRSFCFVGNRLSSLYVCEQINFISYPSPFSGWWWYFSISSKKKLAYLMKNVFILFCLCVRFDRVSFIELRASGWIVCDHLIFHFQLSALVPLCCSLTNEKKGVFKISFPSGITWT